MTGRIAHPERELQTQVRKFVREMVACSHQFAAHDRGPARTELQYSREKMSGMVAGWPDTELLLPGGVTFRCELKAPGNHPTEEQRVVGAKLRSLGHPWAWANSVTGYLKAAREAGVPFRPYADLRAQDLDLVLQGAAMKRKAVAPKSYRAPRATKPRRKGAITTAKLIGM